MSIVYDLYNASAKQAYITDWDFDSEKSLPIAKTKKVQDRIMRLYPQINGWQRYENQTENYRSVTYSNLGSGSCSVNEEYLDITINENKEGYIDMISVRMGSPKLVRDLLEEFKLQYVFEMQSCQLIDPYKYKGNWEQIDKSD